MKKFLYDTLAERWYRGGAIYLYSDPHFGDEEMYKIRFPYGCDTTRDCSHCDGSMINCERSPLTKEKIKELDEWQIKNINARVGKNDTIIFLGDIGDLNCLKKIRGYKILIMGNHEKGASNYKRVVNKITTFNSEEFSDEDRVRIVSNAEVIMKDPKKFAALADIDKYFHQRVEDNHLFDEVYEGPLMISDRIILSHEPMDLPPYLYNIHGHDHARRDTGENHMNVCAEHINYTPIFFTSLLKNGLLKDVESIHRMTIDRATSKKRGKKTVE